MTTPTKEKALTAMRKLFYEGGVTMSREWPVRIYRKPRNRMYQHRENGALDADDTTINEIAPELFPLKTDGS